MAGIPLSLAVPAAAGALAYLNARTQFSQDADLLYAVAVATVRTKKAFAAGKVNLFYRLEELAQSPKTAGRSFIVVPPNIPNNASKDEILRLQSQEISYGEVYKNVLRYAEWLKKEYGVKKGDVIALMCTNKPLFIFLWLAIWSLGAGAAFINTGLRGKSLLHCVRSSTASVLVLDAELKDALSSEVTDDLRGSVADKPAVPIAVVDGAVESRVASLQGYRAADSERSIMNPTDMALLIFTSGTTGLPKPAVCAWRRLYMTCHMMPLFLHYRRDERYYTALPLFHSAGSLLCIAPSLMNGSTVILSKKFSPSTFFPSAAATHATMIQYIGEICRYLLASPPSYFDSHHKIRLAFGNGIRPDVWGPFKERFNISEIAEFYAATESPVSTWVKSKNGFHQGVVGRSGTLIKLLMGANSAVVKHDHDSAEPWRDPKTGFCIRAPHGEAGELLGALDPKDIKDKFTGYFNNEKASNSKIIRDVFKKGDAWFRAGDLMRTDSDGHTFFVDRIGDTFRWKGENVSTGEVEATVSSHPAIAEANVYGVQLPNHDGRAGCAAVIFKEEPTDAQLKDLAAFLLQRLAKYAAPLFLRVVKEMETTGTSKLTKHGLRTQGVDPDKVSGDKLFWLNFGSRTYEPFGKREWEGIAGGKTRL